MAANTAKNKNHTFKYSKIDGFKTIQIHGVYGGLNLRGQLNMNFYVDVPDLPKSTHAPITNNKLGIETVQPIIDSSSLRELHFGINIDIVLARELIRWMENHIKNYDDLQQKLATTEITNKYVNTPTK